MVDASPPAPELALSEQPQTHIDASAFSRPLQVGIGQGLQQLGAGLEDVADTQAKQQAATDLQRGLSLDANGQPVTGTSANSFIFGKAGEDYHSLMVQGLRAELQSSVSDHMLDIRAQNPTDPVAFKAASDAYVNTLRQSPNMDPRVANGLADQAANEGSQHHANLVETAMTRDSNIALQSIQTQISTGQNKLNALARQGAVDTDEYRIQQAQLVDNFDALGSNVKFGYSPEKIESLKNNAISDLNAQYMVGRVDETFTRKGRAEAQQVLEKGILNNPDLDLDDGERKQLYSWGMARLSYLTGEQRAQVDAGKSALNATMEAMRSKPGSIPDAVVDQIITQARSIGDAEGASQLEAVRANQPFHRNTAGLNTEQAFNAGMGGVSAPAGGSERQALDYFTSKGWTPAQAAGIVGNLSRESGLRTGAVNPGDGSDGSDSIGLAQWNGPRAAALKQFAGAQGRSVNDFGTQLAFVQHELETSEGNAAAMLRKAGTAQDAASAFALGYERPQGFMTGDINQVAGGKDRVANAMRLAGGNVSSAIAAPTVPSSNGIPFTPEQLKANPFLASEYVRTLASNSSTIERLGKTVGEGLEVQAKAGNAPDPQTLANFYQLAAGGSEALKAQAEKVTTLVSANKQITDAVGQSPMAGQTLVDQAKTIATTQPSIAHTQIAEALQTALTKQDEALQKTPADEALRRGWAQRLPAPLNFAAPDAATTLPQAMADRSTLAATIAARTQVAATSALLPTDLPQVKSIMTSGTVDQRMSVLGAITNAGMSEPILKATLGQLASSKETLPLAVAGSLMRDNPDAARSIIEGHALMQAEPKLAPNKDDFPAELAKVLPFNDMPATTVREGIGGAVQAAYAKMSASANDTTGVLNATRMQAAIDQVTGGVVDYRGAKVIAPWYGASPVGTDAAIRSLTDADFKGARTSDGNPFPAAMLKPSFSAAFTWNSWRLQSAGDGKYLVFSGSDDHRQYLGNDQNGKFVLDLGSKRAAVQGALSGSASRTPFSDLPFANMPIGGPQ